MKSSRSWSGTDDEAGPSSFSASYMPRMDEDDGKKSGLRTRTLSDADSPCMPEGQDGLARMYVLDKLTSLGPRPAMNPLGQKLGAATKPLGKFDPHSGKWFRSFAIDSSVVGELSLQEVVELFSCEHLRYRPEGHTGVVLNLVLNEFNVMCIGDTHVQVDELYNDAMLKLQERMDKMQGGKLPSQACSEGPVMDSVAGISLIRNEGKQSLEDRQVQFNETAGVSLLSAVDQADSKPLRATGSIAGMTLFAETVEDEESDALNSADVSNLIQSVRQKCASFTKYLQSFDSAVNDETCIESCGMTLFKMEEDTFVQEPVEVAEDLHAVSSCGITLFQSPSANMSSNVVAVDSQAGMT
ncbi:hypothetical protein GUITHDRAFT_164652, partial [Guillardia theta CCMP2712]